MFGLPDWVGDTISLIALAVGAPAIILWFLNRKGANRKLNVEEGGLTVSQFNAALPAYKDLLDRSEKAASEAEESAKAAKDDADSAIAEFRDYANEVAGQWRQLRDLLRRILLRTGITMTPEEAEELEMTKPRAVPRTTSRTARKK